MPADSKWFGIENILLSITLCICGYFYFADIENNTFILIFGLLTLIPSILEWTPLYSKLAKQKKIFSTVLLNLKYSSFLFIAGIMFSRVSTKNMPIEYKMSEVFLAIFIFLITVIFSFLYYVLNYMYEQGEINAEYSRLMRRSNIKGFSELIQTIENENGNILLVAGNLMSLKTKQGTSLLKKFLQKNNSNMLKLIIPKSSSEYLTELKNNIGNSNKLLDRIEVSIYHPFWFLQGIVIVAKKTNGSYKHAITPIGCYYYKIKFSEEEDIAEDGIYIDLSGQDPYDDYPQAISAYYFLLDELRYSQDPFEVEKIFKCSHNSYSPKIETVKWSSY